MAGNTKFTFIPTGSWSDDSVMAAERLPSTINKGVVFSNVHAVAGAAWNRHFIWSGEGELLRVQDNRHGEIRHEYDAAHRFRRRILSLMGGLSITNWIWRIISFGNLAWIAHPSKKAIA